MRIRRVLVLLLVATTAGLLSGAGAGAAPTATAAVTALVGAVPQRYLGAPEAAPPAAAEAPTEPVPQAGVTMVAAGRAPAVAPGTPCRALAQGACVDLSSNQAWLLADGVVTYGPVPITSGRRGFRTPAGTFSVDFHSRDHVSSIYDAPMPYSVFFNGGIAFHQGSLSEQSHGCIHLSRSAAKEFFSTLDRGDVVQLVR